MNNNILPIFRKACNLTYRIVGPNMSTQLARSFLGRSIFKFISGDKKLAVYKGMDNLKLKLTSDEALWSGFLHLGAMNIFETNLMKKILKQGDIVIDIGTYIDGWHSLVAAKLIEETGHVYAFEPEPSFYKRLCENVKINNLKNITAEKLAVSDKNGKSLFYLNDVSSSLHKPHAANKQSVVPDSISVATVSLDSYVKKKKIKKVAFMKIDAESAEMDVLKGTENLLKRKDGPDLIIEVSDVYLKDGGSSENELLLYLKKLGYKAYSIEENGLGKYVRKSEGRQLFNVFFSKRKNPISQ